MAAAAAAALTGVTNGPFTFFAHRCNWTAAEAHCGAVASGHLATILTNLRATSAVSQLCHQEECWIGFNDIRKEGTWVWIDGSEASKTIVDVTKRTHVDQGFESLPWRQGAMECWRAQWPAFRKD